MKKHKTGERGEWQLDMPTPNRETAEEEDTVILQVCEGEVTFYLPYSVFIGNIIGFTSDGPCAPGCVHTGCHDNLGKVTAPRAPRPTERNSSLINQTRLLAKYL